MGRLHRPLRGGRRGRDPRPRLGLSRQTVSFRDGAIVKAGDPLFTIDQRPYQAALDQAEAAGDLGAGARRTSRRTIYERAEALGASTGNITEQLLDQRRTYLATARGDLARRAGGGADRRASTSDFTEINAPMAGRISRKLVSEGNLVNANQTAADDIVSLDPIHFYFDVDERSFLAYRAPRHSGAASDANGNNCRSRSALTDESRVQRARACIDFLDNRLDAGHAARCGRGPSFDEQGPVPHAGPVRPHRHAGLAVPSRRPVPDEAIGTDQDRRIVYVVADDDTVVAAPSCGRARASTATGVIREGLKGDETHRRQRPDARPAGRQGRRRKTTTLPPVRADERRAAAGAKLDEVLRISSSTGRSSPSVLSIVLAASSARIAYLELPVAQYPEIAPPTIVVRASYPGADAETVAATVATPLEQEINGVEDMLYMSSYSTSDGAMSLTITFKLGTDLDKAQVLVQNRVAIADAAPAGGGAARSASPRARARPT